MEEGKELIIEAGKAEKKNLAGKKAWLERED